MEVRVLLSSLIEIQIMKTYNFWQWFAVCTVIYLCSMWNSKDQPGWTWWTSQIDFASQFLTGQNYRTGNMFRLLWSTELTRRNRCGRIRMICRLKHPHTAWLFKFICEVTISLSLVTFSRAAGHAAGLTYPQWIGPQCIVIEELSALSFRVFRR